MRRATLDDVAALVELNDQLGYPTSEGELRDRLRPILESYVRVKTSHVYSKPLV